MSPAFLQIRLHSFNLDSSPVYFVALRIVLSSVIEFKIGIIYI